MNLDNLPNRTQQEISGRAALNKLLATIIASNQTLDENMRDCFGLQWRIDLSTSDDAWIRNLIGAMNRLECSAEQFKLRLQDLGL